MKKLIKQVVFGLLKVLGHEGALPPAEDFKGLIPFV